MKKLVIIQENFDEDIIEIDEKKLINVYEKEVYVERRNISEFTNKSILLKEYKQQTRLNKWF